MDCSAPMMRNAQRVCLANQVWASEVSRSSEREHWCAYHYWHWQYMRKGSALPSVPIDTSHYRPTSNFAANINTPVLFEAIGQALGA
eukprot:3080221-Rhodomonas_salina.2